MWGHPRTSILVSCQESGSFRLSCSGSPKAGCSEGGVELHACQHTAPDHGVALLSQPRHIWKQSQLIKKNGCEFRAALPLCCPRRGSLTAAFSALRLERGSSACTASSTPGDPGFSCRHWKAPCLGLRAVLPPKGGVTTIAVGSSLCWVLVHSCAAYLSCVLLCLPCSLSCALSMMHMRVLVHRGEMTQLTASLALTLGTYACRPLPATGRKRKQPAAHKWWESS